MLYFLHRLHACGWVAQQLMVNVMVDPEIYEELLKGNLNFGRILESLLITYLLLFFFFRVFLYSGLSFLQSKCGIEASYFIEM